jgi:hypothetical protein
MSGTPQSPLVPACPTPPGEGDIFERLLSGHWLSGLPERSREPAARGIFFAVLALAAMLVVAPFTDARGEAWLEANFARTLTALAATRGLDSAISLAQSSEISFSFGPGGSLGIGQALDPVNDLVEQYGALLLTSTTALGVQRLGLQISRAFGWWLFLPALAAFAGAVFLGPRWQPSLSGWGRRLFAIALFARLAIPTSAWLDSLVASRFLEANYQQATASVASTTEKIEQAQAVDASTPWYERYNPIDYVGDRAQRLYSAIGDVGESIVNLAIYFTISTIVLPLGTLWLLARLSGAVFSARGP